ncbi:MAG: metallophosphoesterase [Acidobacteriaceae bacterium]|nr:metallophosphoesterase [Acidobacteriaceae bacterium]
MSQSHNLPRGARLYKFMEARTRFTIALVSAFALVCSHAVAQNVNANGNDNRNDEVSVIQISDTHLGDKHAPHAADSLRQAVRMINDLHPDAVILSGDIGGNPQAWEEAKSILKKLKSSLYYVPGNHDVHSQDVERYRQAFGKDYYEFQVKFVNFVVIDSQLLGNYDTYEAKSPVPLPAQTEDESERMLSWLNGLQEGQRASKKVVIGVQHIPVFPDGRFPDPKPYWVISEPYRSQEMKVLRKLGIKHMLVGHWHNGRVFEREGITWHVAPATSWLPWGGELGFAVHAISSNGSVQTEFVALPGALP